MFEISYLLVRHLETEMFTHVNSITCTHPNIDNNPDIRRKKTFSGIFNGLSYKHCRLSNIITRILGGFSYCFFVVVATIRHFYVAFKLSKFVVTSVHQMDNKKMNKMYSEPKQSKFFNQIVNDAWL